MPEATPTDPLNYPFSYLVYGTGAIGTLVGGRLGASGCRSTFLVRPRHYDAIMQNGVHVDGMSPPTRIKTPDLVTNTVDAFTDRNIDVVILAVKSFNTAEAIADIQHGLTTSGHKQPAILCLQNGIGNEQALKTAFGAENVISGTVGTAVSLTKPGHAHVDKKRGIGIARGAKHASRVSDLLIVSGFNVRGYESAAAMKWSKLLTNLLGNATSAISDLPPGEVFAHNKLYRVEINALKETMAVMRRLGVAPVNLPGTPVKALVNAIRWLPSGMLQGYLTKSVSKGRGGKMPSFHMDIANGKPNTEVGWLNGAVAKHGQEVGVRTPVNAELNRILQGIVDGDIPWDMYRKQPDKLADEILKKR